MELSKEQKNAFDSSLFFLLNGNDRVFIISGVAGSGKSVIINELNQEIKSLGLNAVTLSYTGKAVEVLHRKGVWGASTIHSYLYRPVCDEEGNFISFQKKNKYELDGDFIIVDEASMVPSNIFNDLVATDKPILFFGDENQLPPISNDEFNIMEESNIRLTHIHRQAEGNPIIQLSQEILKRGVIPNNFDGKNSVRMIRKHEIGETLRNQWNKYKDMSMILCGTNKLRRSYNKLVRTISGNTNDHAFINEKIICLRNSGFNGVSIFNGEVFEVEKWQNKNEKTKDYWIKNNSKDLMLPINNECWDGIEPNRFENVGWFDFAYCLSVWKSQGSEFNSVLFVDENVSYFADQKKFRYTAVTRAIDKLIIAT